MKTSYFKLIGSLCLLLLASLTTTAQTVTPVDTIKPGNGPRKEQLKQIKDIKAKTLVDSTNNEPTKHPLIDTTIQNKYGDLLNDDITLNKKYPIWKPVLQVVELMYLPGRWIDFF
ncbi:MAG: hypothetical protein V4553_06345 [Bacteroidota bacterium]